MPMHYRIDQARDLLIGEASGLLTANEIIDDFGRIVRETNGAAYHKQHLFVIDVHTLLSEIDLQGLMRIRESIEAWGQKYPGRNVKAAFVAPHPVHAAVVTLWRALTERYPATGSHVRLFISEEVAEKWLNGAIE